MNWQNPDNWLDLVAYGWYGLVLIVVAAVPSWFANRNHKTMSTIKDQVMNGHKTPMRADLDRAIIAIEQLSRDMRGLRNDVTAIDDMRRQQIAELRAEMQHRTGRRTP